MSNSYHHRENTDTITSPPAMNNLSAFYINSISNKKGASLIDYHVAPGASGWKVYIYLSWKTDSSNIFL